MGIAMGSSPDEVLNAVGWRRPQMKADPDVGESSAGALGVAATALAALGPLVMIGVSQGLGAALIVVATAIAGASSIGRRRTPSVLILGIVPVLAVTAGSSLLSNVASGVRIGAAALGLMLAGVIVAMLSDKR